jgi:hypothetical protein
VAYLYDQLAKTSFVELRNVLPAIVLGSAAEHKTVSMTPLDYYALLKTVKRALGLPPQGASAEAGSLGPLLRCTSKPC